MGEKAISTISYEDYLALETESGIKHEYHDGFVVAMAGGSPEHGQIAVNFTRALGNALGDRPCIVYNSDVKIHIAATNRSYYPDASVVCSKPETSEQDPNAITNPLAIIEVLSEGTAGFDRGAKFTHYRQLSSLKAYILVSQTEAMVDTFFLTENGTWEINTIMGTGQVVFLKPLDCQIRMADIYRLVPGLDISGS